MANDKDEKLITLGQLESTAERMDTEFIDVEELRNELSPLTAAMAKKVSVSVDASQNTLIFTV